ncbi:MAG: calcium/sodium antiporter [Candidatus Delongbacteria bacterium]
MEKTLIFLQTENTLILLIFFIAGLYLLLKGGDGLIKGSASLSASYNIDPFAIGLTVVAFGTSLPEFFVSFISNITERGDIGIGNILGSNIANIALVLGTGALLAPIMVKRITLKLDIPIIFSVSLIFYLFMLDKEISRVDGIVLSSMFIVYIYYVYRRAKIFDEKLLEDEIDTESSRLKDAMLILLGIAGLYIGSDLTIRGASGIARTLGVGELAIGLTVVSVGTSLPELVATLSALKSDNHQIGVGNIIGSNVFNILFVMGLSSIAKPFAVHPHNLIYWGPAMLIFTLILFPLGWKNSRISRKSGSFLLLLYVIYTAFTFLIKN